MQRQRGQYNCLLVEDIKASLKQVRSASVTSNIMRASYIVACDIQHHLPCTSGAVKFWSLFQSLLMSLLVSRPKVSFLDSRDITHLSIYPGFLSFWSAKLSRLLLTTSWTHSMTYDVTVVLHILDLYLFSLVPVCVLNTILENSCSLICPHLIGSTFVLTLCVSRENWQYEQWNIKYGHNGNE